MVRKSKINVGKNTNLTEIRTELSKYKHIIRYYERLIAMEYILEGNNIAQAAKFINVDYQTVHRWAKICEEKGIEGLKPNFGGGRPSKLNFEQLVQLDQYIQENKGMTQTDVLHYIEEQFNVKYSLKQIGVLIKGLGYNYNKAYPRFSKTPSDAEEQLKKNLIEHSVTQNDIIVLFDESSFQNLPNTIRTLSKKGKKNIQIVSPYKFKINATGSLTINGNSSLTTTHSSTGPEIALAFINLRIANMKNKNNKQIMENILNEIDLSEEEINEGLISKNLLNTQFIEKIEKTLHKYEKETTDVIARIVGKHCKSASLDNISKRRLEQREIILESLNTDQIKEINNNEERICLVLDNYSTHKSKFIKEIAEILNITLIYLPPYSPHLNPIEQIWRILKRRTKQYFLESKEFLEELIIKLYDEIIENNNVIDEWYETYIPKV